MARFGRGGMGMSATMNEELKRIIGIAKKLSRPYRIKKGKKFRLKDFDPSDLGDFKKADKPRFQEGLKNGVAALSQLQEMLYAQSRWGVLLVFQAMDAAGKDGSIKHVMSGVNPQGCIVTSFKAPSAEDLRHDFLWRCYKKMPERGMIGIFNRSYYEEVLAVRVHPEFLQRQQLPPALISKGIWEERYDDIRNMESHLARNGFVVRKFFLHLSKEEQRRRFLGRLEEADRNWKFSAADATERQYWNEYQDAYESLIQGTATADAPWYVVPADNKWYARIIIAGAVIDALSGLDLAFPEVDAEKRKQLAAARKALQAK
jgi:PPK2 family polyphosphate:nucleotide phosphotransferase